ncbi:MAG: hypothetical protein JZU65_06160 [Chlorobium sp.]|nr:hypothetical protein [Chlorobium sp.]
MTVKKNELQAMNLSVTEGLTVTILPDSTHEFLMTTKEAANGYGTSKYSIQKAFLRNGDELVEGKHYTTARTYCPRDSKLPHNAVLWTKRGIVRLGFYIKSERSKIFRDWAEDLVIQKIEQPMLFDLPSRQLPARRKHNRLTSERLLSIMADVCRIEDKFLRVSISNKLMMGDN